MKSQLSKNLGNLRKEKQLNQRTVSADLGVSQALLSHYENAAREPGVDFITRACDYYGVSADYMIGRSQERITKDAKLMLRLNEMIETLEKFRADEKEQIDKIKGVIADTTQI